MPSGGHRELKVFRAAYDLAMSIFHATKSFPKAEMFSLTDQIRRSSRSVCANIAEAYRGRQYPQLFAKKLAISDAELAETVVWLDFARDCEYLSQDECSQMQARCDEIGRMLGAMIAHPERFAPRGGPPE
jgi:four helix bundle protein